MADPPVVLRLESGVAHLMLNRPAAGNALTLEMCELLVAHVESFARDEKVAAVLLSGAGDRFCVGGDVHAIAQAPDRAALIREIVHVANRLARGLFALGKPVVAAVHGAAAGGGLSLALLADILVAEEHTTFHTAYTAIGVTPDLGQSWLLPRIVGWGRALDLTLNGSGWSAEQAHEWGMVSRVAVDARATARETALRFANGPAKAYGGSRRLLRQSFEDGFSAHLEREAESIVAHVGGDEAGDLIMRAAERLR